MELVKKNWWREWVLIYLKKWDGMSMIKRGEKIGEKEGLVECIQVKRREELVGLGHKGPKKP